MCKGKSYDIKLYNNKELLTYLNSAEALQNALSPQEKELLEFLSKLFGKPITELPMLSPFLMNWIQKQLLGASTLGSFVSMGYKTSLDSNVYNFSVAKTYQYLDSLKSLADSITDKDLLIEKQKQYSNLVFGTQQKIEEYQTEHMTDLINVVDGSDSPLLEFVSERDAKVRPEHKAQDGVIRPKNDVYWTKAISLLSDYNCRCQILPAFKGAKMTIYTEPVNSKTKYQPSDIDFQENKAIVYSENMPVFENIPPVIRTKFKKNGF
jgi:hypothetical protein